MADTCDWQVSCKKINERGKHLLQSGQWTDCSFLVGSEPNQSVVKGHKLVLAMASPVFEAMFYGQMAETTGPIPIVDVRPEAFKALLEYVYTDNVNINSFDKACEMCYSAKKYMLPHLVEECTRYMWSDLSSKNACRAYEFARLFEEPNLTEKCLQIIRNKTMEVLSEASFNDVDISTVITIFDQPYLNIPDEMILFETLEKYSKSQTFNQSVNQQVVNQSTVALQEEVGKKIENQQPSVTDMERTSPTSSREEGSTPRNDVSIPGSSSCSSNNNPSPTIRNAVQKIRFLTLTPQQFAEGPSTSSLLSQTEAFAILMNISSPQCGKSMPEGFTTSKVQRRSFVIKPASFSYENSNIEYIPSRSNSPPTLANSPPHGDPMIVENIHPTMRSFNYRDRICCTRSVRIHQTDKYNPSILDCSVAFTVSKNICIVGIHVPTQTYMDLPYPAPTSDSYSELLYAHLLDEDDSRLTYTHCTSRVAYRSLLEILFNRPFYVQRNKIYKIGVVFNKSGWYPIGISYETVVCDSVTFKFGVGNSSVRDGLIRSIIFTY